MNADIGWEGAPPTVFISKDPDHDKNRLLDLLNRREPSWGVPDAALHFMEQIKNKPKATLTYYACCNAPAAIDFAVFNGYQIRLVDSTSQYLDTDVKNSLTTQSDTISFTPTDFLNELNFVSNYTFCTDFLERVPEDLLDTAIAVLLKSGQHVFVAINCTEDRDSSWWLDKFKAFDCLIHWTAVQGDKVEYYVTAWPDVSEMLKIGVLNADQKVVDDQVRKNITDGWKQVAPHATNDMEMMILAGGPSLNDYTDKIIELRKKGVKLVTLNGTYHWAIEKGLKPSAQIVVDAREFNNRFTRPVVENCKYLIASQVHPSVLEGLPKDLTYLWHTGYENIKEILDAHYDLWYPIFGGTTVMLRAIPLLRMLGYKNFHLFGFDSCIVGSEHHAYSQVENDEEFVSKTIVGDREFSCHPWMLVQAHEFIELIKIIGDEINLEVYGDGLIAHILKTGAELNSGD